MTEEQPTFVQVVEVWLPEGDALHCQSGFYGRHEAFAEISARTTLRRGEGLPGSVWATGRAQVWEELGPKFVRARAAAHAGLDAGAAFPIMHGEHCAAVVSILCGSSEHTGGCIELWQPNTLRELVHEAGYYGNLKPFETMSRLLRFQSGRGLPGLTWQTGTPELIEDVRESSSFLRAAAARDAGVQAGMAIPLFHGDELAQIITLLSAQATPLAAGFEVWLADERSLGRRTQAYYSPALSGLMETRKSLAASDDELVAEVFRTGLPKLAITTPPRTPSATGSVIDAVVAIPVRVADKTTAVSILFL